MGYDYVLHDLDRILYRAPYGSTLIVGYDIYEKNPEKWGWVQVHGSESKTPLAERMKTETWTLNHNPN